MYLEYLPCSLLMQIKSSPDSSASSSSDTLYVLVSREICVVYKKYLFIFVMQLRGYRFPKVKRKESLKFVLKMLGSEKKEEMLSILSF